MWRYVRGWGGGIKPWVWGISLNLIYLRIWKRHQTNVHLSCSVIGIWDINFKHNLHQIIFTLVAAASDEQISFLHYIIGSQGKKMKSSHAYLYMIQIYNKMLTLVMLSAVEFQRHHYLESDLLHYLSLWSAPPAHDSSGL